jgi:catechol 2,3-dioxygenase-like lactoylglutathione lyase family enzyme
VTVTLDHTIVAARDKRTSAEFLGGILGVEPKPWGPFLVVRVGNGASLDFVDAGGDFDEQHYAFLVDEAEFDPIFDRIRASGTTFYADPWRSQPGEINHLYGGRGVYFDDPDHHLMEVITQPYGDEPEG